VVRGVIEILSRADSRQANAEALTSRLFKRRIVMKRITTLIALWLSICVISAVAQQKRAMTFDDIQALKQVSDAQVSPDGRWVAYVVTSTDMKGTKLPAYNY
jgi:hypothetical protein